jgi:hypothetical protein
MIDEGGPKHVERKDTSPVADEVEEFAGGEIRSFHGRVDPWLLVVYGILAVWGVYYLFRFWGGLGPGLAR